MTSDVRGMVDGLSEERYVALALEFYHQNAPAGVERERNDEGHRRGFEYLNEISRDDIVQDAQAAIAYLKKHDGVDGGIGILGFSAGSPPNKATNTVRMPPSKASNKGHPTIVRSPGSARAKE